METVQKSSIWGMLLVCIPFVVSIDSPLVIETGCVYKENLQLQQPNIADVKVDSENCNSLFTKEQWATAPTVKLPSIDESGKYLLVMADPDAPNHDPGRYYFHWAVGNIPGKALKEGTTAGDTMLSYVGPSPPKGSGIHRYTFILYKQGGDLPIEDKPIQRFKFDLGTWLNDLSKIQSLEGPIAGSQFRVAAPQ